MFSFFISKHELQVIVISSGQEEKQLWSMGKKVVDEDEA